MTESSSVIEGHEPHKSKSSLSLQLQTIQFDSAGKSGGFAWCSVLKGKQDSSETKCLGIH